MKRIVYVIMLTIISGLYFTGCSEEDLEFSPAVPYRIEINDSTFHMGDSLYGRIVVIEDSLLPGMDIKKIDCRLANRVIGSVDNAKVCPFGVRLTETPIGVHTFSVIIKCEAPNCDETYWRYDYKMITIKDNEK